MSAVSPEIVSLVLGEKWLGAIIPLQILCFGVPLRSLQAAFMPHHVSIASRSIRQNFDNMAIPSFLLAPQHAAVEMLYALSRAKQAKRRQFGHIERNGSVDAINTVKYATMPGKQLTTVLESDITFEHADGQIADNRYRPDAESHWNRLAQRPAQ